MKPTTNLIFGFIACCLFISAAQDSYAQGVTYPGGSVQWGQNGRVKHPSGNVKWGDGNGAVNFPGGGVKWDNQGNGGIRINVPGFNGKIRW